MPLAFGLLVVAGRLDGGGAPASTSAGAKPNHVHTSPKGTTKPSRNVASQGPSGNRSSATDSAPAALEPAAPEEPGDAYLDEWELDGWQQEMAGRGKEEMARVEEAKIEAMLDAMCAEDPHAPPC